MQQHTHSIWQSLLLPIENWQKDLVENLAHVATDFAHKGASSHKQRKPQMLIAQMQKPQLFPGGMDNP